MCELPSEGLTVFYGRGAGTRKQSSLLGPATNTPLYQVTRVPGHLLRLCKHRSLIPDFPDLMIYKAGVWAN